MGRGMTATSSEIEEEPKRRSWYADIFIRLIKEKPLGCVGGSITLILLFVAIFAGFIAPYGMNETFVADFLGPPSADNLLGGDQLGRDVFSRIVYGARISVIVALAATSLSIVITLVVGGVSGYVGGKFDLVVQRFVDGWMCFPSLVLLLIIMSFAGPSMWNVILVLGFVYGIAGSRIIRGAVMSVRQNVYVQAAVAIGCSTPRILIRHIAPNVMAPLLVLFATRLPNVVLMEASMSFLGFGIPPPTPSWGGMLSNEGRTYMFQSPGVAIYPGVALSIVVFDGLIINQIVRTLKIKK